jgi:DNA processing protein
VTITDPAQRAAYVALALTPGIGPARLDSLLSATGSALGALSAPFAFLCTVPGMSRAAAAAVAAARPEQGERAVAAAERLGGRTLLPGDADFPESLQTIPDPPALLFALGETALLRRPAVAVVGSRDHTAYGAAACRALASEAARAGLVVVSGMARGLDAVAHAAALDAGGGSIGVLGNGLGVVYPAANRALYERMAGGGLLLTEFAPGERPQAHTFPRRNRLISGLAAVTVVVEAGEGSGTLITVATALDQGREVLVVPGPITSLSSIGTNRLLRDGAGPYLEPADLLAHYPDLAAARPPRRAGAAPVPSAPVVAALPDDLDADERLVAEALSADPVHLETVAERACRPVSAVLGILCRLEIAGVVVQGPGRLFHRAAAPG